jgi:cytochrome P450
MLGITEGILPYLPSIVNFIFDKDTTNGFSDPSLLLTGLYAIGGFAAISTVPVVVWHVVEYYRDPWDLRKFPSPSIAGFSSSWVMYHCWHKHRTLSVEAAHESLGDIIRIQPDHVSFANGDAIDQIHGHGRAMMKSAFYDTLKAPTSMPSMFDSRDRVEHGLKRKYVAHVFAPKTVKELEFVVDETTQTLLDVMDELAAEKEAQWVDLLVWVRFYALDIISNLGFGHEANCLKRGSDIVEAESFDSGKKYEISAVRGIYDGGAYNVFWGQCPKWMWLTKTLTCWTRGRFYADAFYNVSHAMTRRRVPQEDLEELEKGRRKDLMQRLLINRKGSAMNLEFDELVAEAAVLMVAGSDTSGTGLINTLIYLAQNPSCMAKARAEVDAAVPAEAAVVQNDDVEGLPYLRACIDESLRLRPPNAYGLPRTVPKGGATIQGHYFKEGTTVSVSTLNVHHSEKYFHDAKRFKPERWLDKDTEEYQNLKKYVVPFSFGSRACIGRSIAFLELQVTIASVIHRFDLEMKDPEKPVPMIERFNTNPAYFWVKIRPRV